MWKCWTRNFSKKIFDRIDVNKKGLLTLEDIMAGARTDAEFQSRLRVMDIDEVDLQQLFEMCMIPKRRPASSSTI